MANKVQDYQRVAKRFAEALLDLAVQQNAVEIVEKDLQQIAYLIRDSRDFWMLLIDQTEQRSTHQKAIAAIADKAGWSDLTKKFLGVVASKRRLAAMDDMITEFHHLNAKRQGIVEAEIYTAKPLPASVKDQLVAKLQEITNSKVRVAEHVAPRVLGGLQVRIGSHMIDDTVEGKLQRLEQALKNAPANENSQKVA